MVDLEKPVVKISMQRFSETVLMRGLRISLCALTLATFVLRGTNASAAPTNDAFSAALQISGLLGSVSNDMTGATSETFEPNHAGFPASQSVWYKWIAPKNGEVQLDTLSSSLDTVLAVYTGNTLSTLRQVAANDEVLPPYTSVTASINGPSALRFNAQEGTTYYFVVGCKSVAGPVVFGWAYHAAGVFRFASEDSVTTFTITTNGPVLSRTPVIKASEYEPTGDGDASTVETYYQFGVPGVLVTVTRVAGSSGRMLVDYATATLTSSNTIPGDVPAVSGTDFAPAFGTLVFDDNEMTKRIVLQVFPSPLLPPSFTGVASNRNFSVILTNARIDSAESPDVSAPRLDSANSKILVRILDMDVDPVRARNFTIDTNVSPDAMFSGPTNSVFNFSRAAFRTVEDVSGYWADLFVLVHRYGTNRGGETVHYRVNNFLGAGDNADPGELDNNAFPLQPGSDYATASPADDANGNSPSGIHGTGPDFVVQGVGANNYNFPGGGTLSWGQDDFQSKAIRIHINNDARTEFNEDFHLFLYQNDANSQPRLPGTMSETSVTILFDDQDPPAGSVDQNHNPDFGASMVPPVTTVPPNHPTPGANGVVYGLSVQSDNKTVIVGDFTAYNSLTRNRIARMNVNGSIDTGFNPGSGADNFIGAIAQTTTGQFVVGGGFSSYNGTQRTRVARINSNGSLDAGFNPGLGPNGNVWAVAVQSNTKVIVAGEFDSVANVGRTRIARLNTDGTLDATFDPGVNGPNGTIWAVVVQSDGKIVIGGEFTTIAGFTVGGIARLNSDGSYDASFNPGAGADLTVFALSLQSDGKILAGGQFSTFNLNPRGGLVRLNLDGTIDSSFDMGSTGADGVVYSISVSSSGIYVGGIFDNYNGTHRRSMVRLYTDGTVDTGFLDTAYNQFAGLHRSRFGDPKGGIYAIGVQTDGNVMIGGGFSKVGGGQASILVRPDTYDANLWTEPKARDGVRNRSNVARLIGGTTPGPGNIKIALPDHNAAENQTALSVALVRENGTLGYLSANFQVEDGLAQAGVDYSYNAVPPIYLSSWLLPFPSSEPNALTRMHSDGLSGDNFTPTDIYGRNWYNYTPGSLIVTINNDFINQGDRNTTFRLSNPTAGDQFFLGGENIPLGGALGFSQATFTIHDDDQQNGTLGFSISNFVVNENVTNAVVTVIRTNGTYGSVSVQYTTAVGGSATPVSDYSTRSGTLTFANGQTNKTFTIPIVDDSTVEPDETIIVRLFGVGGGASLGVTNATVTIVDNDTPGGKLNFSSATYATNESAVSAVITVTRTGSASGTLTVYAQATNGTATAGSDFTGVTNLLTWSNGDISSKTFVVPLLDDSIVEADETVSLRIFTAKLNGATNAASLGVTTTATLTILNDDLRGKVQFTTGIYTANENGGPATITVVRPGGSSESVSVNYAAIPGTAFNGTDFAQTSGTLSFGPGEVSKSFAVDIYNNQNVDAARSITLVLSNASPAGTLGSPSAAVINIVDDESFNEPPGGVDTVFTPSGMNGAVLSIGLQADGKIIAGGDFTTANQVPALRLVRLQPGVGTVDNTFSANANAAVQSVYVESDGKTLVAGSFTSVNGIGRNHIARLMSNGSVDTTFNPGSGTDNPAFAIVESLQASGARKILIGGSFASVAGTARNGIARLNNDGTVDGGFTTGTGVAGIVYAVAAYPTNSTQAGKVLIGGDFASVDGASRSGVARLNSDGSLDVTFNPGTGAAGAVRTLALQADERIVIGGSFTNFNGTVVTRLARLNNDGSLDFTFNTGVGADDAVLSVVVQGDAKIVVGGLFTHCNGVTRNRVTRLNSNGSADPTINFGSGANDFVATTLTQPDGKILIGGGFTEYDGAARQRIARIYGGSRDGSGSFEFTSANYQATENSTNVTLLVRRRGGTSGLTPQGSITVDAVTSDDTATNSIHYVGGTTTLTFPAGEVFETLVIPIIDNIEVNTDRSFNVALGNINPPGSAAIGNQPTATVTIINDDSAISFASSTFTRIENAVDGKATISIVRSGATSGISTVDFTTTTNGTATPILDYSPTTNRVTFAVGETIRTVTIPIVNDTLIEGNETVGLALTNVSGAYLLAPDVATLTIVDDDMGPGKIAFTTTNYFVSEGGGNAVVNLIRTNGSLGVVSVKLQTTDVTATSGQDFTAQNNITVIFGDGEVSKNVLIPVLEDTIVEGDETFNVTLSNPTGGATIAGTNTAAVTIVDNDVGFSFSSPIYLVGESASTVTISVLRIGGSNGVASVNYSTVGSANSTNFSATAGSDFTGITNGLLSFANGEVLKTFTVSIISDTLVEGDETFGLTLSNPSAGVQLLISSAVTTILDDDTGFTLSTNAYSIDEGGTNLLVTVYRTNANTGPASVFIGTLSSSNFTATPGVDYTAVGSALNFTNGESVKTIVIPIVNDLLVEGDETFGITLSSPSSGAQIFGITSAVCTIIDNDAAVRFTSSTYNVNENGVQATITVVREAITNSTVAVNYATSDGTATGGADYVSTSGQLVFTNGQTSKTFTVQIIDDTLVEGAETVLLSLSSPTGQVQLVSASAATLTIVDNDGGSILPAGSLLLSESIAPTNNAIDPSETVTVLFALRNVSGVNMTNLIATLLVTNGITVPSAAQSYGALVNNGASASRPFTFTASGTNGGTIAATFNVAEQSGQGYGRVTFNYVLGTTTTVFSNTAAIIINDNAIASPYPSSISVTGLVGTVSKVIATITNLYHPSPDDIDMLLAGPTGTNTMLMSDCGGGNFITNVTLTFDDAAATSLPDSTLITSGTNKPTNFLIADLLPSPAPPGPWGSTLSVFNGTNPNGLWSIYIKDDLTIFSGSIQNGWQLAITTLGTFSAATDLAVTSTAAPNPVVAGSNLTYTVTVTNYGPWAATGVQVTNALPAGATFVSATVSRGTFTTNAGVVTWNVTTNSTDKLAKDGFATATIVVIPSTIGSAVAISAVAGNESDPNTLNNVSTKTVTVVSPQADLAVTVIDLPDPVLVAANSTLIYSITVTNSGPATALFVGVTNTLPPGVLFVSASPAGYTVVGSVVTFANLGNIGAGATTNLTITVTPLVGGQVTNTTVVGSPVFDPIKGNNTASVKTIVSGISFGRVGNGLVISWPSDATATLQSATNLTAPIIWQNVVSPAVVTSSGMNYVTNTIGTGSRFFRLHVP